MNNQTKPSPRYFTFIIGVFGLLWGLSGILDPVQALTTYQSCTDATKTACSRVQRASQPHLRVLIATNVVPASMTVDGGFVVQVKQHRSPQWKRLTRSSTAGQVDLSYDATNQSYSASFNGKVYTSDRPIRVTPLKTDSRITISNWEQRPAWNPDLNDNSFYGSLEIVWSDDQSAATIVNIVPLERYVAGIAETGSGSDSDYIKSILTAARTYALFKKSDPKGDVYVLDTTEGSQLYRGANYGDRAPDVVAAAHDTRHQVITYNDTIIVAPYFSRSDGRTRSWADVWGGEYPWAQSVADPCCTNETLYGHGVGMSGKGALYFADQGWGWKKILKYYYTGVAIQSYKTAHWKNVY